MTSPVHGLTTILAVVTGLLLYGDLAARERQAPPPDISCERDQLTSYTGRIVAIERGDRQFSLVIDTDWDTRETVLLAHECEGPERHFLLNREAFTDEDWALILDESGQPAPGLRATAWVCQDGRTPTVVEWHAP
jgi:hypothetical protein